MNKPEINAAAVNSASDTRSLFGHGRLLVSVALGLALCQLPLLLWLLPTAGLDALFFNSFPAFQDVRSSLQSMPWLPLALATAITAAGVHWTRVRIVKPLLIIRQQMLDMSENRYAALEDIGGSVEIEAVAQACESLRTQMIARASEHLKLAYEDSLTGLHNRLRFIMTVDQVLKSSIKQVIVIVWSLDRFSSLTHILGFAAGDHLIKSVAARVRQQLGDAISVARLSSHTFACALEMEDHQTAEACIQRILDTLTEPVRVFGQPIELSAACGAALSPRDGQAASDLTRRAEIAQSLASQSRLRWLVFQNHFEVQSSTRLNMLSELRAALQSRGQLQLHLQPKLDLHTGRISAAEALVRWQHPQRGLVYPNEFIPFAEQTGRIHEITLWAIAEALDMINQMQQDSPVCISVNISAMDLHEPHFVEAVAQRLQDSSVNSSLLCLEITESWAMDRPEQVLEALTRLHGMGIKLAIDDFGSGYSSMGYMKRFPVDELKIDRSLVAGIKRHSDSETILRCITELGHHMGLQVTAEGVETLEEYAAAKALSIDCIQGYLIGKAMPLPQFRQFLQGFDSREWLGLGNRKSDGPANPAHLSR